MLNRTAIWNDVGKKYELNGNSIGTALEIPSTDNLATVKKHRESEEEKNDIVKNDIHYVVGSTGGKQPVIWYTPIQIVLFSCCCCCSVGVSVCFSYGQKKHMILIYLRGVPCTTKMCTHEKWKCRVSLRQGQSIHAGALKLICMRSRLSDPTLMPSEMMIFQSFFFLPLFPHPFFGNISNSSGQYLVKERTNRTFISLKWKRQAAHNQSVMHSYTIND